MRNYEDDFEIEAIEKCSRALSRLDDSAKIRVIKYLLDKFGLIAQSDQKSNEVINNNIHYQQNNLVLSEPKDIGKVTANTSNSNIQRPINGNVQLKDVIIKGLTKSESEIILITCFINSNFGKDSFSRQSILDTLREHNVYSDSRRKGLTAYLNNLTKRSFVSRFTDNELMITETGVEEATNILNGTSTTKKRKPRLRKAKTEKTDDN